MYWQGRALFGLAQAQLQMGQLGRAAATAAQFDRIASHLRIRSTDDQITDPRVLDAMLALARGDTARGHDLLVAVLASNQATGGTQKKIFHTAFVLAAECALALGKSAEALNYAHEAREMATLDSLATSQSALVGEAVLIEARGLLARGDSARARVDAEQSATALRNGAGAGHPRTREAERLLAALSPSSR